MPQKNTKTYTIDGLAIKEAKPMQKGFTLRIRVLIPMTTTDLRNLSTQGLYLAGATVKVAELQCSSLPKLVSTSEGTHVLDQVV